MVDLHDKDLVRQPKKTYDDSITSTLLEQYKMYVQTADNVSSRRVTTSRYLLTLSVALIAVYGFQSSVFNHGYWVLSVFIVGVVVSVLWYQIIKSYHDLNTAKFKLIHELEEYLPAPLFTNEWRMVDEGRGQSYTKVTDIERKIPFLFIALHVLLASITIFTMMG